jgi:hypothetical protein
MLRNRCWHAQLTSAAPCRPGMRCWWRRCSCSSAAWGAEGRFLRPDAPPVLLAFMRPRVQLPAFGVPSQLPQQQRGRRQLLLWAMQRQQRRSGSSWSRIAARLLLPPAALQCAQQLQTAARRWRVLSLALCSRQRLQMQQPCWRHSCRRQRMWAGLAPLWKLLSSRGSRQAARQSTVAATVQTSAVAAAAVKAVLKLRAPPRLAPALRVTRQRQQVRQWQQRQRRKLPWRSLSSSRQQQQGPCHALALLLSCTPQQR